MLDYMLMAAIDPNVRTIISNILIILMSVISVAIIVIVLMQESETGGMSAITGNSNDSVTSKEKTGITTEQKLKRATLILGAVMLVLSVVFFIVKPL